jgi:membrane protease YdiL (CAAX protease family)
MQEQMTPSRTLLLVETALVTVVALVVSAVLGVVGLFAVAFLVESDPIASLVGMERKLDVRLTPADPEALPGLDETRTTIDSTFDSVDVIVVPEDVAEWRLLAWVQDEPTPEDLAAITNGLTELGWGDVMPTMTTQQRLQGALENPHRMRSYIPPAMTGQAFLFVLVAWLMVRWRKPLALGVPAPPGSALAWGVGAALIAFVGSTLVGGGIQLTGLEVEEQPWIRALMADRSALLALTPWIVVLGPISEEVFFRGYVFRRLFSTAGPSTAYLASALLFAAVHWHPVGFPMYTIIGLVFCWVYQKTGNLWAPVIGHVTYNALVVGIPLLASPTP